MEPDKPPQMTENRLTCRPLGGLWVVLESEGEMPENGSWSSIMTLGYDLEKKHYVGTFVASIIAHLWLYEGSVDESGNTLTLNTEGPRGDQEGMAKYQDIIEIIDDDNWVLSSQILEDSEKWRPFMSAGHRRRK